MIKERACDDAIDALDAARSIRSFPQAIETYTYWNLGEPLLIVDAVPKPGQYQDHTYVVVRSKAWRSARISANEPEKTIYNVYSKNGRAWRLLTGVIHTLPTADLNVNTLEACANNSKNKWASSITGTSDQVNARTSQQYEELYAAVKVDDTSKISIRQANLKVNGASLLFRYICSFPT